MKESNEVREVVRRFYERMSAGDVEGTSATIDDDPKAFVIGTQRIGSGRETWMSSVRENVEAGVVFEAGDIHAWAEGDFGWAIDEPTIVLPDGTGLPTRMTAVLRRAGDGGFRLLHQHYSVAVPDELAVEQANAWREQLGLVEA